MRNSCFRHLERCRRRLNRRGTLSSANYGFCYLNLAGFTKSKYEKKNEKDSGRSSKMVYCCQYNFKISLAFCLACLFVCFPSILTILTISAISAFV